MRRDLLSIKKAVSKGWEEGEEYLVLQELGRGGGHLPSKKHFFNEEEDGSKSCCEGVGIRRAFRANQDVLPHSATPLLSKEI